MFETKLDHQQELERLYDKNQLMRRIKEVFQGFVPFNFSEHMQQHEIPEDFGFNLLAQMAVHKRATVPTLVGCLRHHCESDQATALMLEQAVQANLVEYSSRDQLFIVIYEIGSALQEELNRFQYPLPMVVRPRPVETNLDTGYLNTKGSVILQDNFHHDDVCLDHLNRINGMKLTVNLDVAKTVQNKWRGLDRKKVDETWEKYQERKKAFEKYDSVAKDVMATLFQTGNEIYLTHRYDFRGRTYCMGFHINYQGTDWNKAVLEFADKELLDE